MASPLLLQVHRATLGVARSGWEAVTDEFAAADLALSRHRDDSELTRLNRVAGAAEPLLVGWRLRAAIAAADRARRVTEGRFDARVLASLVRLGDVGAALPEPRQPPAPAARDPRSGRVALDRPYDLGGIGKGLALRWAGRRLDRLLAEAGGWTLEAGGDLVAAGRPDDAAHWSIGIEDPSGGAEPVAVIEVERGAVCTSSVARRSWRAPDGAQVHHLIDPRTGQPGGEGLLSVTVAGSDPAWSEVWSKALILQGVRGIGELARARGSLAWWVEADGSLHMTPAARSRTAWTADEAR